MHAYSLFIFFFHIQHNSFWKNYRYSGFIINFSREDTFGFIRTET